MHDEDELQALIEADCASRATSEYNSIYSGVQYVYEEIDDL